MQTSVHVTKATKSAVIYENVDTGLTHYPIAFGNWEKQPHRFHGHALITDIIGNQIFINKMFALAITHMQSMAIPKIVYNANLIPAWNKQIGQAIGIHNLKPDQPLPKVAEVIHPPEMSAQVMSLIDKTMQYTRECLGATDAQMGNVRPDNTSALMVLQTNAEVPLENIRANLHEWVEDIVAILLDFMGNYYGSRPVRIRRDVEEIATDSAGNPQINPNTGLLMTRTSKQTVMQEVDFSFLKHLSLDTRIDVGAAPYYSRIAMVQTLDGLLRQGVLTNLEYLERMPDQMIPMKQELIDNIQAREAAQGGPLTGSSAEMSPGGSGPIIGAELDESKLDAMMTPSTQSVLARYPDAAKRGLRRVGQISAMRAA